MTINLNKVNISIVATTWAHELMHVARIGSVDPMIEIGNMKDYKYGRGRGGPQYVKSQVCVSLNSLIMALRYRWKQYRVIDTKWLAFGDASPEHAPSHHPQNYAFFALANHIVSKKGFFPYVQKERRVSSVDMS
jgi:hypothetical protein